MRTERIESATAGFVRTPDRVAEVSRGRSSSRPTTSSGDVSLGCSGDQSCGRRPERIGAAGSRFDSWASSGRKTSWNWPSRRSVGVKLRWPRCKGPNRRVRTRTHGGATGKAREGLPMSIDQENFAAIGIRRPTPKARLVTFRPVAACLRLYSFTSTMRITFLMVCSSKPAATMSAADCSSSM